MVDISRRQFVMGSGALILTNTFAQQASAAYIDTDKLAQQLMDRPVEQWPPNILSSLSADQRQGLKDSIVALEASVETKTKQLIRGAAQEAQGPSLQDKMDMARQNAVEGIARLEQARAAQLNATQQAARDAAITAALNPGSLGAMEGASASFQNVQNMVIAMCQDNPRLAVQYQQMIDQAVQAEVKAEQARDAHNVPLMAFAPESARMIPGQVRNREVSPEDGTAKAMADLKAWYGRALDTLDGKTVSPGPALSNQGQGFQPPSGYQPP